MKKKTYLTDYAIKIFDKAKSNYVTASKIKVRVYQDRDTKEEVLTTEAVCAIEKEYAKQAGRMFCDDIVELRENLGYSQRQFAEELGLGGKTLVRWESGRDVPSLSMSKYLKQTAEIEKLKAGNKELEAKLEATRAENEKLKEELQAYSRKWQEVFLDTMRPRLFINN